MLDANSKNANCTKVMADYIRKLIACFVLLAGGITTAWAQQTKITTTVDSAHILIGQPVKLVFDIVTNPDQEKLQWPVIPESIEGLEQADSVRVDTVNGLKHLRQTISVTGFDSGQFTFPSLQFYVKPMDGSEPYTINTDSVLVNIRSVAVDTTQPFKPIYDIMNVPKTALDYWPWYLAFTTLLALILAYVYWRKSRKKELVVIPPPPPEPAHIVALRALQQLEGEKVWQRGDIKSYHSRLTEIFKEYVEARFGIPAVEQTTEDFLQSIKPLTQLNQQREKVEYVLRLADLVKFAKTYPGPEENEGSMDRVKALIEWTKAKVEEVPEEETVNPQEK